MINLKPTDLPLIETEAKRSLEHVINMQRDYSSGIRDLHSVATEQYALARMYHETVLRYDELCVVRRSALGYAVRVGGGYTDPRVEVVAARLARRVLKYTGNEQVPHPNEYLSEEQRGVLVLLDKLEPPVPCFDATPELVERAQQLCQ